MSKTQVFLAPSLTPSAALINFNKSITKFLYLVVFFFALCQTKLSPKVVVVVVVEPAISREKSCAFGTTRRLNFFLLLPSCAQYRVLIRCEKFSTNLFTLWCWWRCWWWDDEGTFRPPPCPFYSLAWLALCLYFSATNIHSYTHISYSIPWALKLSDFRQFIARDMGLCRLYRRPARNKRWWFSEWWRISRPMSRETPCPRPRIRWIRDGTLKPNGRDSSWTPYHKVLISRSEPIK